MLIKNCTPSHISYVLLIAIMFYSCISDNSNSTISTQNEFKRNIEYRITSNANYDIGKICMIHWYIRDYNLHRPIVFAYGEDSVSINNCYKHILPDVIEVKDLPIWDIPKEKYLTKEAMEYVAGYITTHCDTILFEDFYSKRIHNRVDYVTIVAAEGEVYCTYDNVIRKYIFFKGMYEWLKKYPIEREVHDLMEWVQIEILRLRKEMIFGNHNRYKEI